MATAATIAMARDVRQQLAGSALTERQAKLYSQRLRLDMGREGLASFATSDVDVYFDEAMLLVQCALIESHADLNSEWRTGLKRAAEILEWFVPVPPSTGRSSATSSLCCGLPACRLPSNGARTTPAHARS